MTTLDWVRVACTLVTIAAAIGAWFLLRDANAQADRAQETLLAADRLLREAEGIQREVREEIGA